MLGIKRALLDRLLESGHVFGTDCGATELAGLVGAVVALMPHGPREGMDAAIDRVILDATVRWLHTGKFWPAQQTTSLTTLSPDAPATTASDHGGITRCTTCGGAWEAH